MPYVNKVAINKTSGSVGIFTTASTFPFQVGGDVGPDVDNLYSLGSPQLRWKRFFGTASFADSASWAPSTGGGSGSGTTLTTGSTYPITASWAVNVVNGTGGGTTLSTGSYYPITSSVSLNAITASWADTINFGAVTTWNIPYRFGNLWVNSPLSYDGTYIQALFGSYGTFTFGDKLFLFQSHDITSADLTQYGLFVSNGTVANPTTKVQWSPPIHLVGASLNTSDNSSVTNDWTIQVEPGTAPDSSSVSSSFHFYNYKSPNIAATEPFRIMSDAVFPNSAGYYFDGTGHWSVLPGAAGLTTGSTYPITASWAINSVSGGGGGGTTLTTGSTYPITSSWAKNIANAINPTYVSFYTASQAYTGSTPMERMVLDLYITSSHINADGSDLRVQKCVNGIYTGSYLPARVTTTQISNSIWYNVSFKDTFVGTTQNYYAVTYGDPNATPMTLTYPQYRKLTNFGAIISRQSQSVMYIDNTQADRYADSDWGTIGARVTAMTNADDVTTAVAVPAYWYNDIYTSSINVNSNCIMGFVGTNPGGSSRDSVTANSFCMVGGDGKCLFCDYVATSDGFAFQYAYQYPFNVTGNILKTVWRYYTGGKWVFSLFDANSGSQAALANSYMFSGYIGGVQAKTTFPVNPLTASVFSSARAMVIEPIATASVMKAEFTLP